MSSDRHDARQRYRSGNIRVRADVICGMRPGAGSESTEKRLIILPNMETIRFSELRLPEGFPPAMAYVPWQELELMYPPETALRQGTLFPELDKPFEGRTLMNGGRNVQ